MEHTCVNHSENQGQYYCGKYNRYLCDDCMKCQDPSIYCKHRSMCLIWEFSKYGKPDDRPEAASIEKATGHCSPTRVSVN